MYVGHPLHAKLYLLFRSDPVSPMVGYLGSSNLTFSGLSYQGELNVDVLDHDAAFKLSKWFEERWLDRWYVPVDPRQVQDGIDLADQVIGRNHLVEVELIEQMTLTLTALTHHHTLPSPIALTKRNHDRQPPSTDFCNTICQMRTSGMKLALPSYGHRPVRGAPLETAETLRTDNV